jgi:hypothetical protein
MANIIKCKEYQKRKLTFTKDILGRKKAKAREQERMERVKLAIPRYA